jgi:hypothetical protein
VSEYTSLESCNVHKIGRASKSLAKGLLVDVTLLGEGVLGEALGEPESDLLEGVLDGVGSVADVSAHVDGVVASDGSRLGGKRVGG